MRVLGRGLVLGGLLSALATAPANATPILSSSSDSGAVCDDVLGVANSNCRLFSLGALTGAATFNLELASDRDVALFEFFIDADATFAAETSSTGLFPLLGLFSDDATKTIYSYTDPNNGELQAFGFERLDGVLLDGVQAGTSYYLAVLLYPNGFTGIPTSLMAPFACDGENRDGLDSEGNVLCPGAGGSFSLRFSATSTDGGPQPVPEPATFTLVAGGALAALVRRRSTKRNQRKDVTKS